jgi:hypothetical protein
MDIAKDALDVVKRPRVRDLWQVKLGISRKEDDMNKVGKADGLMRNMAIGVLVAASLMTATRGLADDEATAAATEFSISGAWESRYATEGRDNLDGDSLAGTTIEAAFKGLSVGAWYASSPDVDYREFDASLTYSVEWNDLEAYISYTHLRFLADEEDDNEIGVGFAYSRLPGGLALGLDSYYSFEAEGAFLEASIGGEYEVLNRLTLAPSAVLGWNSGYISDGHDGANHFMLSCEAIMPIKDGLDLAVTVAYSWAIDADPERYPGDETLADFPSVGVALRAAF